MACDLHKFIKDAILMQISQKDKSEKSMEILNFLLAVCC